MAAAAAGRRDPTAAPPSRSVVTQPSGRNRIQYVPAGAASGSAASPSVSSATLEQLREFESVLEAVSTRGEATGARPRPGPGAGNSDARLGPARITPESSPAASLSVGGSQFVYSPDVEPGPPDDDSSRGSSSSSYRVGQPAAALPARSYTPDASP